MELKDYQKTALTLWNDLGDRMPAHPVLAMAYEQYFSQLGLWSSGFVYDALAALENPDLEPEVTEPVLNPEGIDKTWSQYPTIAPLLPLLDRLTPVFASNGSIVEFNIAENVLETDPDVATFLEKDAPAIFDLTQTLGKCAKFYIDTALNGLIMDRPESEEACRRFCENPRRYAEDLWNYISTHGASSSAE
jgi:hypothetical protein